MFGLPNSLEDAQRRVTAEYEARRRALQQATDAQIAALRRRTAPLRQTAARTAQGVASAGQAARDLVLGPAALNTGGRGNPTSYHQMGMQYVTGLGPRHQVFGQNDPATQILRGDANLGRLRDAIAGGAYRDSARERRWDNKVGGWETLPKDLTDYASAPTLGRVGNLADGYLGSYDSWFKVRGIDPSGAATVDMHVSNGSDLKSLSHYPVVGRFQWWKDHVEPHIIAAGPKSGPFSPTSQDFYWTETIPLRRTPVGGDGVGGPAGRLRP